MKFFEMKSKEDGNIIITGLGWHLTDGFFVGLMAGIGITFFNPLLGICLGMAIWFFVTGIRLALMAILGQLSLIQRIVQKIQERK